MWRLPRRLIPILCVAASAPSAALAQPPASTSAESAPAAPPALPDAAQGAALLAAVEDYTLHFDDPAFYWLLRRVREVDLPGAFAPRSGETPVPWTFLAERPGEYRGRIVVVEGVVESCLAYEVTPRDGPPLGRVFQLELSDAGAPRFFTVISAADERPIPLRSRVRARGYFLKMRQYRAADARPGYSPLIVAHHIDVIAPPRAWPNASGRGLLSNSTNLLIVATAALAVVWLILRRATARPSPTKSPARPHAPAHSREAPPTPDDLDWMKDRE